MVTMKAPTGEAGTVHLSVSDASGDSAIFEYIDGKLVIHHGKQYQVMTNSPIFSEQIGAGEILEGNRWSHDAAGHQPRDGPVRACFVLHQ